MIIKSKQTFLLGSRWVLGLGINQLKFLDPKIFWVSKILNICFLGLMSESKIRKLDTEFFKLVFCFLTDFLKSNL